LNNIFKNRIPKKTSQYLSKEQIRQYFEHAADQRLEWKRKNRYYHQNLESYFSFIIPPNSKVLEIGCGTGELLNSVKPAYGVGIDLSEKMLSIAKNQFPRLEFYLQDIEDLNIDKKFDYIILSDLVGSLWDIQKALKNLNKLVHQRTRIIISFYNYLWEPILKFGELIGIKQKQPIQNWLSIDDIENLLALENFEIVKIDRRLLFPFKIPLLSMFMNRVLANISFVNKFCLVNLLIARARLETNQDFSVSIIIPAKNEMGNIENAIRLIPKFGASQEIIFVEGDSSDKTYEEMLKVKGNYKNKNIIVLKQSGNGKGNAVREGFDKATGDVLMILDADLTVSPEDLPKFYYAIQTNRGEFINGCRLIYQMDKMAMRFLNLLGNKFFSLLFSYLLGQRLKDTLCGTKVLFKKDYNIIKENRSYFDDFDPFGDFDLLFGAAKLNLKIIDLPIRYKEREYGSTQIRRFSHGWLLFKMSLLAAKKIKFI
jgi:SAM-dependent methyltransferase